MSRRKNLIDNVLYILLSLGALFALVYICSQRYYSNVFSALLKIAVGAIVAGLIVTFMHELGHLVAGKRSGFAFAEMRVWFFKWKKVGKKTEFSFCWLGEEAGYTDMIPKSIENLEKRFSKMVRGALIASFIAMLIGIPPLFIKGLSVWIYCIWGAFFPVGAYVFFGNALPMLNEGLSNDGAVLSGIRQGSDSMNVALSILKIQAEMYQGKTPKEIEKDLYFDLPQLPEDDPNFVLLLNARYNYYLDLGDYENAKKVTARLLSLEDEMPKAYTFPIKTDALYNACTFDFDEEKADDLVYELEKYLNNVNTATNVRAKLAYILNVKGETETADIFYKKGIKEADRCQIKGYGAFEKKLIEDLFNNRPPEE
ncbi:MAG: hypothetical protein IJC07_00775 [Clostridia bacterium]|nr:hypothetical protein [Clostridia bacterium]